jgi:hypothetical protein
LHTALPGLAMCPLPRIPLPLVVLVLRLELAFSCKRRFGMLVSVDDDPGISATTQDSHSPALLVPAYSGRGKGPKGQMDPG